MCRQYTLTQIKEINKAKGGFFFSPATVRFCRTSNLRPVYSGMAGVFFITIGLDGYKIRQFDPATGDINTVDSAITQDGARKTARQLAQGTYQAPQPTGYDGYLNQYGLLD